jgi:DNA repair protein RadC
METATRVAEIEVSYRPAVSSKPIINSALDAFNQLRPFYLEDTINLQEQFLVAYLNKANKVIGMYRASIGGISGIVADPRLILAVGLRVCFRNYIIT